MPIGHGWHQDRTAEDKLTPQERTVLQHVLMGKRNAEIAAALNVTKRSVAGYMQIILSKLGLEHERQLFGLVILARREMSAE